MLLYTSTFIAQVPWTHHSGEVHLLNLRSHKDEMWLNKRRKYRFLSRFYAPYVWYLAVKLNFRLIWVCKSEGTFSSYWHVVGKHHKPRIIIWLSEEVCVCVCVFAGVNIYSLVLYSITFCEFINIHTHILILLKCTHFLNFIPNPSAQTFLFAKILSKRTTSSYLICLYTKTILFRWILTYIFFWGCFWHEEY